MENSFFHKLSSVLWIALVGVIVVLAIYVSFGRLVLSNVGSFHREILAVVNNRVPFAVEARAVTGGWVGFTPELVLQDVTLSHPDLGDNPVALSQGRIAVDVWSSLLSRSLQFTRVHLDGLTLWADLSDQGRLTLKGFDAGDGTLASWARSFVLNLHHISVSNLALEVDLAGREQRELTLDLDLLREGSQRSLRAQLLSSDGNKIDLAARGVGNPFEPAQFSGRLYLDFELLQLELLHNLVPAGGLLDELDPRGELELELWLDWDRGQPGAAARVAANHLLLNVPGSDWQLPLDQLTAVTRLVSHDNHWLLFAEDLWLRQGQAELAVDRLQVDSWGDSLRLRAQGLPLDGVGQLVQSVGSIPEALREVFAVLDPRGELERLELTLADRSEPARHWKLAANFDRLALESWRGAPGVSGARGHVALGEGGGVIQLDSRQFSLHFPTVYLDPLFFDEVYGSLRIGWDQASIFLDSGPITATALEGTARALFGLDIPRTKTPAGVEMDLLVGLRDSHPMYRSKYLPYILPSSLLDWLASSVGDGHVRDGAFLWRGSLRHGQTDLRTVQLFFNLEDTSLTFHPRWPSARVETGTVLVDDFEVSVWAERARFYDAIAEQLSVEAWRDPAGRMLLAARADIEGSAADGLKIVNESPLGDLVGHAFDDWNATGGLEADLFLELALAGNGELQQVEVATRWQDVTLGIQPGGLTVEHVNGDFKYSGEDGFSSRQLAGQIWGRPLTAQLRQRPVDPAGDRGYTPGNTVLDIDLQSRIPIAAVQDWLQLQPLSLAAGEAGVAVTVTVAPRAAPRLAISSALEGVSLDLPEPWGKTAEELRDFQLDTTLAEGLGPLRMSLDKALYLDLDAGGGEFNSASLAFGQEPPDLLPGFIRIAGAVERVNVDQCLDFVRQYLSYGPVPEDTQVEEKMGGGPSLSIESLYAGRAELMGREWQDLLVDLSYDFGAWSAELEMPWLRGALELPGEGLPGKLDVSYLELDGLFPPGDPEVAPPPAAGKIESPDPLGGISGDHLPTLPDMVVRLGGLHRGGRSLGELQFDLLSGAGEIRAANIRGTLAGMAVDEASPALLVWREANQGTSSDLQLVLNFEDLGDTLESFGYEKILETKSGRAELALDWPGSPAAFSLAGSAGRLDLGIEGGAFRNTSAGTSGALRVVSILNLTDIVSRLSLTQMFETGVPFHSLDGDLHFHRGTIEVEELKVLGSSSAFQFTGLTDVEQRSLNGELVVTLPVANNLPWVAALTAGLPVAAGVFVVSKLFEDEFSRLSSGVYSVTGSWNNPEVTFTRIFDNASQVELPGMAANAEVDNAPAPDPEPPLAEEELELDSSATAPAITNAPDPTPATDAGT